MCCSVFSRVSCLGRSGKETNEGDELKEREWEDEGGRGLLPQTRHTPELSLFAIVFKFGRACVPLLHKVAMGEERDG